MLKPKEFVDMFMLLFYWSVDAGRGPNGIRSNGGRIVAAMVKVGLLTKKVGEYFLNDYATQSLLLRKIERQTHRYSGSEEWEMVRGSSSALFAWMDAVRPAVRKELVTRCNLYLTCEGERMAAALEETYALRITREHFLAAVNRAVLLIAPKERTQDSLASRQVWMASKEPEFYYLGSKWPFETGFFRISSYTMDASEDVERLKRFAQEYVHKLPDGHEYVVCIQEVAREPRFRIV